jgi:hypothetical protein
LLILAPFGAVCALIFLDGDFDLPENLFGQGADRRAQCVYRAECVEIENRLKILVLKIHVRIEAAAGYEAISNADRRGVYESHFEIEIVVFL